MEQGLEQHIIARAVTGSDSISFGRLVKIYQAPIRGFLRRLTRDNHSLADDLAQDTFLTAFRKISRFRNEGSFRGWLFQIAYRSFLMHKRKKVEDQQLPEIETANETGAFCDPVDRGRDQSMKMDIERAMTGLSEVERASLTLCFTYGMSHGEAAAVLGQPLGTLKSHVARGKAKLKVSLASWHKEMIS